MHERLTDALLQCGSTMDRAVLFPSLIPEAAAFVLNNPYAFAMATCLDRGTKAEVFVYRVNRYPPTRLEADRCCKVAVGRGGAEVRRKSASTVWRALGGNDPFGLCRGFLPGTSSWRRDSRFP